MNADKNYYGFYGSSKMAKNYMFCALKLGYFTKIKIQRQELSEVTLLVLVFETHRLTQLGVAPL